MRERPFLGLRLGLGGSWEIALDVAGIVDCVGKGILGGMVSRGGDKAAPVEELDRGTSLSEDRGCGEGSTGREEGVDDGLPRG